jgi:hypothetical protein
MKAMMGILGLVVVLAIGYQLYTISLDPKGGSSPKKQIDLAGVQTDLLSLAQAERLYFALNGAYATLDQLQQSGNIHFQESNRRGYHFAIEIDGIRHFRITATPADPEQADWPAYSTDETQQITILRKSNQGR